MTLALWNKVQAKLLPTPSKFHYLFNMRELSKVRTGCEGRHLSMHSASDRMLHHELLSSR